MNQIVDFVIAALPWVVMGLFLAFAVVILRKRKNGEKEENYSAEGMCLGMCLGTAIGSFLGNNIGLGISMGMLLGMAVGAVVKKK